MKTTITKDIIEAAGKLAEKGYSNGIISDALKIGYSTCRNNKALQSAIKTGRAKARQQIVDDLLTRSREDQSSTATIFLAKQLKVFEEVYPTSTPKTAKEAADKLSAIYDAVSKGELDAEKGSHLAGYLEKFIKAFEASELEERIKAIEKELENRA